MKVFSTRSLATMFLATMAAVGLQAQEETTDLSEFFITNPHFTMDEPVVGGICTYDYDCEKNGIATTNYSLLPVHGWTRSKTDNGAAGGVYEIGSGAWLGGTGYIVPDVMSDGSTEGKVLGIVTCWGMSAQYTQNVTLPAGTYTLSVSYYNTGGETDIVKNLIGFICDDGTEFLGEATLFPVGEWSNETVEFTLTAETSGKFSMGYTSAGVGSGSMPHFFIDGISLVYEGTGINPSLLALQMAVNAGNKALGKDFYNGLRSALETAVSAAQQLIDAKSEDEAANAAAAAAINEQLEAVNASIAAYVDLEEFYYNTLAPAIELYSDGNFEELLEVLEDLADDIVMDVFYYYTWDDAKIAETIASFDSIVSEGVEKVWREAAAAGKSFDKDLDISSLFDQLDHYNGTSEWTSTSANYKVNYGTAEVWNETPFTVSRTLTNMPAGTYTITTKAFYRTAANDINLENYSESATPTAFLFAGAAKTPLTNVAVIATDNVDAFPVGSAAITDESGANTYVPNTQEAAEDVFTNGLYTEVLQKSVSTVLVSEGDLTFGVKADAMESNCWVIWYTFTITYNAVDPELVGAELAALMDEVASLLSEGIRVTEADSKLTAAYDLGDKALSGDAETQAAAVKALKEAIAYAEESIAKLEEANALSYTYVELYYTAGIESDDNTINELIEEIQTGTFATNEAIDECVAKLVPAWSACVFGQPGVATATEDNPFDVTVILNNPNFDAGNANYWTITGADATLNDGKIGQNQGYQSASYTNDETGLMISQFIEAWRPSGAYLYDGDISQTIAVALPEGYYRLEVDGYATNQDTILADVGIQGAYLMATNGTDTWTTNIGIGTITGVPEHFAVNFYSDGQALTTVGIRIASTNASWVAVDNFVLKVLGKESPEAVGRIEKADEIVGEYIYNLSGQRLNAVQKGLNIVRRRMSDGTVVTRKVIVK